MQEMAKEEAPVSYVSVKFSDNSGLAYTYKSRVDYEEGAYVQVKVCDDLKMVRVVCSDPLLPTRKKATKWIDGPRDPQGFLGMEERMDRDYRLFGAPCCEIYQGTAKCEKEALDALTADEIPEEVKRSWEKPMYRTPQRETIDSPVKLAAPAWPGSIDARVIY